MRCWMPRMVEAIIISTHLATERLGCRFSPAKLSSQSRCLFVHYASTYNRVESNHHKTYLSVQCNINVKKLNSLKHTVRSLITRIKRQKSILGFT